MYGKKKKSKKYGACTDTQCFLSNFAKDPFRYGG